MRMETYNEYKRVKRSTLPNREVECNTNSTPIALISAVRSDFSNKQCNENQSWEPQAQAQAQAQGNPLSKGIPYQEWRR